MREFAGSTFHHSSAGIATDALRDAIDEALWRQHAARVKRRVRAIGLLVAFVLATPAWAPILSWMFQSAGLQHPVCAKAARR